MTAQNEGKGELVKRRKKNGRVKGPVGMEERRRGLYTMDGRKRNREFDAVIN